jgi:hypothetical protein
MSNQNIPKASNGRPMEQMIPTGQPVLRYNQANNTLEYKSNGAWLPVTVIDGVPYTGAINNVDLNTHKLKADRLQLSLSPSGVGGVGYFRWNNADGTAALGLKGGNVTLQIGQETILRAVNKSGVDLLDANFQAVKIIGAAGQRLSFSLAQADSDDNSATTIGLVTENINRNQEGFITVFGRVNEINTTGSIYGETWQEGDVLYLSPTTPGALTNVKPVAPLHMVTIGYVEYAHANHGKIFVKVDNGYEINELHNVNINEPTLSPYSVLVYDFANGYWTNKNSYDIFPLRFATTTEMNAVTPSLDGALCWNNQTRKYYKYEGSWIMLSL